MHFRIAYFIKLIIAWQDWGSTVYKKSSLDMQNWWQKLGREWVLVGGIKHRGELCAGYCGQWELNTHRSGSRTLRCHGTNWIKYQWREAPTWQPRSYPGFCCSGFTYFTQASSVFNIEATFLFLVFSILFPFPRDSEEVGECSVCSPDLWGWF